MPIMTDQLALRHIDNGGAVYNMKNYATVDDALTVIGATPAVLLLPPDLAPRPITAGTIPAHVTVRADGGTLGLSGPLTLTRLDAGLHRVFSGAIGSVTFAGSAVERIWPQWFGAQGVGAWYNDGPALQAAFTSGALSRKKVSLLNPGNGEFWYTAQTLTVDRSVDIEGAVENGSIGICGVGMTPGQFVIHLDGMATGGDVDGAHLTEFFITSDNGLPNGIHVERFSHSRFTQIVFGNVHHGFVMSGNRAFALVWDRCRALGGTMTGSMYLFDGTHGGGYDWYSCSFNAKVGVEFVGAPLLDGMNFYSGNFEACGDRALLFRCTGGFIRGFNLYGTRFEMNKGGTTTDKATVEWRDAGAGCEYRGFNFHGTYVLGDNGEDVAFLVNGVPVRGLNATGAVVKGYISGSFKFVGAGASTFGTLVDHQHEGNGTLFVGTHPTELAALNCRVNGIRVERFRTGPVSVVGDGTSTQLRLRRTSDAVGEMIIGADVNGFHVWNDDLLEVFRIAINGTPHLYVGGALRPITRNATTGALSAT